MLKDIDIDFQTYASAKRWVYIFVVLFLYMFVMSLSDELASPNGFTALGVTVSFNNGLSFLALVIVLLYVRLSLLWRDLPIKKRRNTFMIFDHAFLGGANVGAAFVLLARDISAEGWCSTALSEPLRCAIPPSAILLLLTVSMFLFVLLYLDIFYLTYRSFRSMASRYENDVKMIFKHATTNVYELFYAPDSPESSKIIIFKKDGTIPVGGNENEYQWRIDEKRKMLVLLHNHGHGGVTKPEEGADEVKRVYLDRKKEEEKFIFSRFRYHKHRLAWLISPKFSDWNAKGLTNQYMVGHDELKEKYKEFLGGHSSAQDLVRGGRLRRGRLTSLRIRHGLRP